MADSSSRVDRILSIAAGIAAVTAVVVSLYQAALARQQLRASAWPYLAQTNSYTRGAAYQRAVTNEGVGPARVRSFRVTADGRPVTDWEQAVKALTGELEPALVYSSFRRGTVLPPGASRTLLILPSGPRAERFWMAAQTRLSTSTCYCSVYDECWISDSQSEEPRAVNACPRANGRLDFQQ